MINQAVVVPRVPKKEPVTHPLCLKKDYMTNFPNNLRALRESDGISQEYLAEELGVSRQAITSWECAHAEPNICMLVKIAKYFKVSVDELVTKKSVHVNYQPTTDEAYNGSTGKRLLSWNPEDNVMDDPMGIKMFREATKNISLK